MRAVLDDGLAIFKSPSEAASATPGVGVQSLTCPAGSSSSRCATKVKQVHGNSGQKKFLPRN